VIDLLSCEYLDLLLHGSGKHPALRYLRYRKYWFYGVTNLVNQST